MDSTLAQNTKEQIKAYQSIVKKAQAAYWRAFLENAKMNNVWIAHQFTKKMLGDIVPGRHVHSSGFSLNKSIMHHFFLQNSDLVALKLPVFTRLEEQDEVDGSEVSQTLQKCSNNSVPGPDQVPYRVWKHIYDVNRYVTSKLINHWVS